MPNPTLRTDYLSDLGGAYGRGQSMAANLDASRMRGAINKANLDEYYQEIQFRQGLSNYIKSHPEMGLEEAGEKFSLSVGRPEKAMEFRKGKQEKIRQTRAGITGFFDSMSKANSAGVKGEALELFAKSLAPHMLPQEKGVDWVNDFDWENMIKSEEGGYPAEGAKRKDGSLLFVDSSGKRAPVLVAPPKTPKTTVEKMVGPKGEGVYRVPEVGEPEFLGGIPKSEKGGGSEATAFMKNVRDIMRNMNIGYKEAVDIFNNSKTMTREQFLMNVYKALKGNIMFKDEDVQKGVDEAAKFYDKINKDKKKEGKEEKKRFIWNPETGKLEPK